MRHPSRRPIAMASPQHAYIAPARRSASVVPARTVWGRLFLKRKQHRHMASSSPRLPAQQSDPSAQSERAALLDALWDASALDDAATVAALLTHIIDVVRRHPNFEALGLGRLVDWLAGLRARQPDHAQLFVGRAAVNRLIDKIVAAFEGRHHTGTPRTLCREGRTTTSHVRRN